MSDMTLDKLMFLKFFFKLRKDKVFLKFEPPFKFDFILQCSCTF